MSSTPRTSADHPDVFVGTVGRAHGVRGEVLVHPDSDNPARFAPGGHLFTGGDRQRELVVRASRSNNKGGYIVAFDGLADRDDAETLRGTRLFIARSDRRPLEEGEFWPDDLEGLEVRVAGTVRGHVDRLDVDAAQPRVRVHLVEGTYAEVPFVEALVPVVDTAHGYIEVVDMDGLLNEPEAGG